LETVGSSSELNYTSTEEIRKKFIFESKDKGISRSYIFGYEKDNPSYEFLKTKIFLESSDTHSTDEDTIYTHNLESAKQFFLTQLKGKSHTETESVYTKITQHFLFNIYTMSPGIDVFVAFETMNNRGKPLSNLELLKNRLIFISTLITTDTVERTKLRSAINESWKTAYHYLGKNRNSPLSDDHFLFIHFQLYIGRKSDKGTDREIRHSFRRRPETIYKHILLNEIFTTRNINGAEENRFKINLTLETVYEYAQDLKRCVKTFYEIYNPDDSDFILEQRAVLKQISRMGWERTEPLIVAAIQANPPSDALTRLLRSIERYIFIRAFRPYVADFEHVDFTELATDLASTGATAESTAARINQILENYINRNSTRTMSDDWSSKGHYNWPGINYLLFEYEQGLKQRSKSSRDKISWPEFDADDHDSDYATVEHIYPQRARDKYWTSRFSKFTSRQKRTLQHSLGNLLALSRPKNSALGNLPFPTKRDGTETTVGYRYGSYSENEAATYEEWTAENILERGIRLLNFIEKRWGLPMGDIAAKTRFLGLDFVTTTAAKNVVVTLTHVAPDPQLPDQAVEADTPADSDPAENQPTPSTRRS
ncbi:DUF262 domain-containing protein, partial [Myxococcus vastator]|uniref:DUF262 domain-containing protein n=1 Tax=Myxococcus vastator TaxID=2709664 RepID=UPI0013D3F7CB